MLEPEVGIDIETNIFRELVENLREVCWMVDLDDYRVLYVNQAYEEIWGRTRESIYQEPNSWIEAIHPDDRERVSDAKNSR